MNKLLNLTIKIDHKDKYKDDGGNGVLYTFNPPRIIEPTNLSIEDQEGATVTQLKIKSNSGFFGNDKFLVNDIRKIKIPFQTLDIPISWAWENKGIDTEIEFTLKNLKYDENKGFVFGGTAGATADTLFLSPEDFEVEVYEDKGGRKHRYLSSVVDLSDQFSDNVKKTFRDFLDLNWKITKTGDEETVTNFVSEIESYQSATTDSLKQKLYQLKNINNDFEGVKDICEKKIKEIQDLNQWKIVGIKTLNEVRIAQENGFDIIADPSLKHEIKERKYKGFSIVNLEKHKIVEKNSFSLGSSTSQNVVVEKNRYIKDNIDMFRNFFTDDLSQSDPKYFRGFRPGDIKQSFNGKFFSVNHQADIRDKSNNQWEIKKNEKFFRTHYEIESYSKQGYSTFNELIEVILKTSDLIGKTKKEILDANFKEWWESWEKTKISQIFYQNLTDLFWSLDKNFVGESRENCETALNTLKTYENLPNNQWLKKKIKNRYSSEIEAKKNEITDRMKVLFQEDIKQAMNEDYGSGSLSPERKRIFTAYRNQIVTSSLLTKIKELIKSLVKAEKFITEFKNLDKMASLQKLKEEYQNGNGDKKTAYTIVNQVDNQWVDRIITELGTIRRKDPQVLLAEIRTQLKTKYANDEVAQAIFDNEVLDSVVALHEAEKLLIKVREARAKNDVDASLLTLLQNYQKSGAETTKNKAWQAVNSYNHQAETAIKHLQKADQSREEIVKAIQEAKNEKELKVAYNWIQDSELYKQGGKSKTIIKNLERRKRVSLQLDQENISTENKNFLQIALVKLISETIKDDNDEQELVELEKKLKTFKNASESEEKGEIYQRYKKTIDQVLTEIRREKQRYQQTKVQIDDSQQTLKNDNQKLGSNGRLPDWAWGLIIIGLIAVTGTVFLYFILYFYQQSERKIKK